jgi:hypothetical protein
VQASLLLCDEIVSQFLLMPKSLTLLQWREEIA